MFFVLIVLLLFGIWLFRNLTSKTSDSLACLVGKTAVITGGNSGIGYATSLLLASRGCRVIIADKANSEKSRDSIIKLTGNPNILTKFLDLSSLKSVRDFGEEIKKHEVKIDILINNAGIGSTGQLSTADGLNTTMQINYFGPFLLTHLLIDLLRAAGSARVIFTGSTSAIFQNILPNNLNEMNEKNDFFTLFVRYANSKLCNILASQEFGKRLKTLGIVVNSSDPGLIRTALFQESWLPTYQRWILVFENIFRNIYAQSPMVGAQTNFHLASSLDMEGKTGGHYFLCRSWFKPRILNDQSFCTQIWEQTEKLVALSDKEKLCF